MFSEIKRKIKLFLFRLKRNRKKLLISEMAALVVLCTICAAPGIAAIFAHKTDTMVNQFTIEAFLSKTMVTGSEFAATVSKQATAIVFTDEAAPEGEDVYDLSEAQDGGVVGWYDGTTYNISTQRTGEKVIANEDMSNAFNASKFSDISTYAQEPIATYENNLESIDVSCLDTSKTKNMSGMFRYDDKLKEITGMQSIDTSNVTDMSEMFRGCTALTAVDLSSFNTLKTTTFFQMFYQCRELKTLNISNFNVSNTADASTMFYACYRLERVHLGASEYTGFLPAPSSTYIDGADGKWYNLETGAGYAPADIPSNTAATYVAKPKSTTLVSGRTFNNFLRKPTGVSTFAPEPAVPFDWEYGSIVFTDEEAPSQDGLVDLSKESDGGVVAWLDSEGQSSPSKYTLKISTQRKGVKIQANSNMSYMFEGGQGLSKIDFTNLDFSNTQDMSCMFYQTIFLENSVLDMSKCDTTNVSSMWSMFRDCIKLEKFILGDKFAWAGDAYRPVPNSAYIDGADGKWYNLDTGAGYAPADIPSNTAATYVAVKPVKIVSWADGTDEEIAAMVAAADRGEINLADYWSVGDERQVTLSAMDATGVGESHAEQTVTLVLMHQGGYKLVDGSTCNFVVGQKNGLAERGYMNSSASKSGSWDGSARRAWCNSTYYDSYPAALKPIFKQFKTITAETYNGSTLKTSIDYFSLPAEKEVFSVGVNSNQTEANALTQFDYYKSDTNKVKSQGDNGIDRAWWMRSPISVSIGGFCAVSEAATSRHNASNNNLLAPFGCI